MTVRETDPELSPPNHPLRMQRLKATLAMDPRPPPGSR
jgi:hypothetical protein